MMGTPPPTETLLLEELAGAWESLEALHEIPALMAAAPDLPSALTALVTRVAQVRPGLAGGVWVERASALERADLPAIARDGTRPLGSGVIGHAIRHQSTLAFDRDRLDAHPNVEPEFQVATRLLAVPFQTGGGVRGALVLWSDVAVAAFDSRLSRLAESVAAQAALTLENDRLIAEAAERERFAQDLEIGARIQAVLLAAETCDELAGVAVATFARSARQVGGDFYDIIPHGQARLDVLLGDVMGKGVSAALLGAATKVQLLRAFAAREPGTAWTPDAIVRRAHGRLVRELITLESFVTLGYARLDWASRTLTHVDCGHGNTWRIPAHGRAERIGGNNLPLGVRESEWYLPTITHVGAGDLLVFCSDGVTEARSAGGDFFGDARLLSCLRDHADRPISARLDALRAALDGFTGRTVPEDDQTVLLLDLAGMRS
jgi:serine phosphatase RsbU (regulator of sigma subunit)